MARSVGEAISTGLESGLRLAMDIGDRQDAKARQERLDAQATAGLQRAQQRQDRSDVLAGLGEQEKMLAAEGQGLQNGAVPPTPEQQQDFEQRTTGLRARKSQELAKVTGVDVAAVQKAGQQDIAQIKTGDIGALKPGQFTRGITVGTGRPPTDYLRQGDQPAPVELAAGDFVEGLHGNDQPRMLKGLNAMFAPELRKGVGSPGAHGGTIIAKQIVDLHPDPRGKEEDPHVIPMLRVYVTGGTPLRGPLPDGVPPGATGYYDAPLTKGRGSDPKDTVKSIGIQEAQDFIDKQVKLVELMNAPEAQQKLQEDAQAGDFDPMAYQRALMSLGISPTPKETTEDKVVPADAVLISTRKNARTGQVLSRERIAGGEKTFAPTRAGTVQEKVDAIDAMVDDATLTKEEGDGLKRQLSATVARGGKEKVAGAAATDSNGVSLKEREQRRKELKDLNEADSRDESNARSDLAKFDERIAKSSLSVRKDPTTQAERTKLASRLEAITARIDDRKRKIEKSIDEDENPGLSSGTRPAAKAGAVLKFDKNGVRIP